MSTKKKSITKNNKKTKKSGFKPTSNNKKFETSEDGKRRVKADKKLVKKLATFFPKLETMHPDLKNHRLTGIKIRVGDTFIDRPEVIPETFENGDTKLHRYECELKLKVARSIRLKGMGSIVVDSNDNTIYPFRLASEHQYSASAGGIINAVLDNDPSTTPEYTSLTALFSLVRITRARYRIVRAVSTAVPTTVSVGAFRPMMFVPLIDNAGAPGSYAQTEDSPNVVMYDYAFDTSAHGMTVQQVFRGTETPLWADTSVPASATSFQGCPGCLQIYGESMPVTTECIFVMRELFLEFTNRI